MMFRKYVLPVLAIVGVWAVVWSIRRGSTPVVSVQGSVQPAVNPFKQAVSGAGIVEPESENIAVSPAIGGIVTEVLVKWGDSVKEGQPLYQIDARPLQAQIASLQADVELKDASLFQAQAGLERLQAGSRVEDKKIAAAHVSIAKVLEDDAADQWNRLTQVANGKALSEDEASRRHFSYLEQRANHQMEQANYDKVMAGSWDKDILVQQAAVKAAEADVAAAKSKLLALQVDLDRLTVRAPVEGRVLRINMRKGEYVPAANVSTASDGAVVVGDVDHLNVRVDIDEADVPRYRQTAAAFGFVRGSTQRQVKLEFVRIEPFVVPKRNLTGANTERVDTRVLQVIYRLVRDGNDVPLYVGEQMDVYVESSDSAPAPTTQTALSY